MPKTTEQHLFVHSGKSEAEVIVRRLDSQTLRPVDVLGLLVFSNNI